MNATAPTLEQQATLLRDQGKGYEAVKVYEEAKRAYLKAGDLAKAAGCQHMIGVSYKIENDLEKAIPAYDLAIKDYRRTGDKLGPGRVARDIGITYEYRDQLTEAENYLQQSRNELEALPNSDERDAELGITLAKIGLVYTRTKKYDDAEKMLHSSLELLRKSGHTFYELTVLMHLGALYFMTQHYGRMLANFEAALGLIYEYDMASEQTRRLAQIWGSLAHGYLKLGNKKAAKRFAKKALDVVESLSETARQPVENDIAASDLRKLIAG